ncbi:alpha/beta fold hydrolase [Nocardia otitidiscaviarum]|uniref:alpha/beta fold hydrolase n=1 Tax=Nocardia otitidiscaviarum TaxID=1823 RepID=UPI0018941BFE|nr:alpha/beta hydrolase [Nocardia otitidiscaviarum]MBF6237289.1 alpha/beta fold hydrolase [Nocardia otitidiscaviarum]
MTKLGRFTDDAARAAYLRAYDAVAAAWPVPWTDIDVETSFGTTRVRRSGAGEGTPLFLFPGMQGNGLFWSQFITELAHDRTVYTPDVMGWAGRCVQTSPLRDENEIADWAAETIAGLGADHVHLAGYSLGGWLAAVVAAHRPDRVASLSLLEPAPATFARPGWRLLWRFMVAGFRPTRAKMEKFNQWIAPRTRLTESEWAMLLASFDFRQGMPWARPLPEERFAAISAPLLALFGGDTVVQDPGWAADHVRRLRPDADIETYAGAGHDMIWAIPDRVIPRFLEFVRAHEPEPSRNPPDTNTGFW